MHPGLCLGDRYTLEDLIGTSAGGSVWTGHDSVLDRPVRIKVLATALSATETVRARFRSSTLDVASLQVPGVIDVFDCVEYLDGADLVVCQIAERVDGRPLSHVLAERGLDAEAALSLIATAALVLHEAHEAGARHLNLKPTNLIVAADGSVTITDFAYLPSPPGHPYAAPEQRRGEECGVSADVFSLGAIAYECLTGGPPAATAPLPDDTAPAVAAFIGRALSPNPAHRFGSAETLAAECEQIIHTSDVLGALLERASANSRPEPEPPAVVTTPVRKPVAPAPAPAPGPQPKPRRKRLALLAVIALAIVTATAVTVSTLLPESAAQSSADGYNPPTDEEPSQSDTDSPSPSGDRDRGGSTGPTSSSGGGTSSSPSKDSSSSPTPAKTDGPDSPDPPKKVKVPNVVGDDRDDAVGELKAIGLKVNVVTTGEGDFACPIHDQNPNSGTSVVKGTTVDIKLKLAENAEKCGDGETPATGPQT